MNSSVRDLVKSVGRQGVTKLANMSFSFIIDEDEDVGATHVMSSRVIAFWHKIPVALFWASNRIICRRCGDDHSTENCGTVGGAEFANEGDSGYNDFYRLEDAIPVADTRTAEAFLHLVNDECLWREGATNGNLVPLPEVW